MTQPALKPVSFTPPRSAVTAIETFRLRRVLARAVSAVGDRLMRGDKGSWEFDSPDKSHITSRYDLEALGFIIRYLPEFLADEKLPFVVSIENEELPLKPITSDGQRLLRGVIDPVDGSKAFDNYKCASDVPIPPPSSAVSVALVDPLSHELVATAVFCFDQGDTFSSCLLNPGAGAQPEYVAYRNETILVSVRDLLPTIPNVSAKRRVLNGKYNSRALVKLAELEMALMDEGLSRVRLFEYGIQRRFHTRVGETFEIVLAGGFNLHRRRPHAAEFRADAKAGRAVAPVGTDGRDGQNDHLRGVLRERTGSAKALGPTGA